MTWANRRDHFPDGGAQHRAADQPTNLAYEVFETLSSASANGQYSRQMVVHGWGQTTVKWNSREKRQ